MAGEDGEARIVLDAGALKREIERLESAARSLDRGEERQAKRATPSALQNRANRAAARGRQQAGAAAQFAGRLGGAAFGVLAGAVAVDKIAEVARAIAGGQTFQKAIGDQVENLLKGPLRTFLRTVVIGIVIDVVEERERLILRRLDERLELERQRQDIATRLRNDPTFLRATARQASQEFERSATRQRQLREAEEPASAPGG